jgi:DNA-binding response OmpR family regulator
MHKMPVVLFVDDEAPMRRVVQHALTLHGIEVHTAAGLAEARAACERIAFDGAIVDVWLDDGSGFELYAWLQEHYPRVARHEVRAIGRPVLVKPFDFDELEDLIRSFQRTSGSLPAFGEARTERDARAR